MASLLQLKNGSDIRGVALPGVEGEDVNLSADEAGRIANGFVSWLESRLAKPAHELCVALGRDSRLSGESLVFALVDALSSRGVSVLNCGLATTPAMFMSCVFENPQADASIMVTASHLPWNRNGLKFFTSAGGVEASDIEAIIELSPDELPATTSEGSVSSYNLLSRYATHLQKLIRDDLQMGERPLEGLSIVVDAGNGAGGFFASEVLEVLGADVSASQYLEPNGNFPNHAPNPEDAEAMESICAAVKESGADLGIIFDTDVDRSSAVDERGEEINRNAIVALAAALIAPAHPGTTVVTDSVTSDELSDYLESELGLQHLRFKRGYRNVINKMIELNTEGIDCQLAIETSGHAAFLENYSLDDGAYLATRIVCAAARLKKEDKGISELISGLKHPLESKEFRLKINEPDYRTYGNDVLKSFVSWVSESAPALVSELMDEDELVSIGEPNYEGVRLAFSGPITGWALLRLSLHDPLMPLNIESSTAGGVDKMLDVLQSFFASCEGLSSLRN